MNLLYNGGSPPQQGPHTTPGGTEQLDWKTWDTGDLAGKSVILEIIDHRKGTWGHVNVDQITASDTPAILDVRREFAISARYLVWPVTRNASKKQRFFLTLNGETEPFAFSNIALSDHPDFWAVTDLANFQGRKLTVTATLPREAVEAWNKVGVRADYPGSDQLYREPLRPGYHFTSRRGWSTIPTAWSA